MAITSEQLRDLVFAGESAYKQAVEGNEAQAPAAQRALLQLQAYLSVRASQSPAQRQQVAATLEQCTARLHTLRVRSGASEARYAPTPLCERAAHPQKRSLLPTSPAGHATETLRPAPPCTGGPPWRALWPRQAAPRASASRTPRYPARHTAAQGLHPPGSSGPAARPWLATGRPTPGACTQRTKCTTPPATRPTAGLQPAGGPAQRGALQADPAGRALQPAGAGGCKAGGSCLPPRLLLRACSLPGARTAQLRLRRTTLPWLPGLGARQGLNR